MIAKKCCGWWPSSHLGATCPKIHCWRCLKHRHRASQCELSNVWRGSKFEKSDRHRNWIEVETAFYHFGWKRWRNAILRGWRHGWPSHPRCMRVRQLIIHREQISAFIFLNRPTHLKCHCESLRQVKRWKGVQKRKSQLILLPASWGFDAVNTPSGLTHPHHTPVSRSAWKAVSREAET